MLKAAKSVIRSKAAAWSRRLAEAMDGLTEAAGEAVRDAALGLGARPSPHLVPVRVRTQRPTSGRR